MDVLLVVLGITKLEATAPFYQALVKNMQLCTQKRVPVILIAYENRKPRIDADFSQNTRFFVPPGFLEKDLSPLGAYLLSSIKSHGKGTT